MAMEGVRQRCGIGGKTDVASGKAEAAPGNPVGERNQGETGGFEHTGRRSDSGSKHIDAIDVQREKRAAKFWCQPADHAAQAQFEGHTGSTAATSPAGLR
jgi:hypothetical protein